MSRLPKWTQVLVIGGGPAGSTAATLLAREGFDVTLLEREIFPRYHIGESLLPSSMRIFDLLGVRDKIEAHGFQKKQGAVMQWGPEQWTFNFGQLDNNANYSFQVIRSEFDQLLLNHAKTQGVKVFEGTQIKNLSFDGNCPKSATWLRTVEENNTGEIAFDFIIDASGRDGILPKRYLKNRQFHESLQSISIWGYWKNATRLPKNFEGALTVSAMPSGGWLWGIPLHDNTMNIGVVMHKSTYKEKRTASLEVIYKEAIATNPLVAQMAATGELISRVEADQDYSYSCDCFANSNYYIIGDAACFLDPLLSSGVHLATYSALLAAASLSSVLRGEVEQTKAADFYDKSFRQAYMRFLVFVSSFYNINRDTDTNYWQEQKTSNNSYSSGDLEQAFVKMISGMGDLWDIQNNHPYLVITESLKKPMEEKLKLQHKDRQSALSEAKSNTMMMTDIMTHSQFFNGVQELFSLSAVWAVNNLCITTQPSLGLIQSNYK